MASARAVSAGSRETERVEITPAVGFGWLIEGVRPYLGYIFIAAGLIALFVGWWGVSGTALVAKQLPYIASAGLVGVVLVAIGNRIFMTNDLRRDSGRLDRLEQMVAELHAVLLARTDAVAEAPASTASAGAKPFRAVPKGTSYHLPECSMVQGKDTIGISRGEVSSRKLRPCRMCHPDAA
ncbi:MAG: hypothetical protein ACTHK4_02520 [Mycobacteriales bacterium]